MTGPAAGQAGDAASFAADTELMGISSQAARRLADELRGIRAAWAAITDHPGQACGYREVQTAYLDMQNAWFAEIGVYVEVQDQAADRLHDSAEAYAVSETKLADRMKALGG